MSPNTMKLSAALSLAVLAAGVAVSGDAHAQACGMGDIDWYGVERDTVSRASDMLERGDTQKAASLMQHMWPRMHEAVPVESSLSVIADGVRVMALASVRSGGKVPSELGWSSWTPLERSQNVAWSVQRLRMLAATRSWSSLAKADLGEALARSASTEDEARTILEALDSSKNMASPEGYAALAFVRDQAGDTTGAELASEECNEHGTAVQCALAAFEMMPAVAAAQ
jgi:hypothetical protein